MTKGTSVVIFNSKKMLFYKAVPYFLFCFLRKFAYKYSLLYVYSDLYIHIYIANQATHVAKLCLHIFS